MIKKRLILIATVAVALSTYAAWQDAKFRGRPAPQAILAHDGSGYLIDSGVTVSGLTNAVGLAGTAEQVVNKGAPNGYAGLDENGKIDAELVESIIVVFVGGEAVDVP